MEQVQDIRLETQKLVLRTHVSEDAPVIAELLNNLNVSRWTSSIPYPYALKDAEGFIDFALKGWEAGRHAIFVVDRKEDGKLVGTVGLHEKEDGEYELGYWFGEPYWGKGYASEAVSVAVAWVLSNRSVARLYARYDKRNLASERVMQKAGLTVSCGSSTCFSTALNQEVDSNLMEYPL